jgi:O-antigen chain-terminating methyltransferase
VPLAGYLIAAASGLFRLPALMRRFQALECRTSARFVSVEKLLARKADSEQAEQLRLFLEQLSQKKAELSLVEDLSAKVSLSLEGLSVKIREQTIQLLDQQQRLNILLDEAQRRLAGAERPAAAELAAECDHAYDALYALFEEKFRGSRDKIRTRQERYLPCIHRAGPAGKQDCILDLGCGRGEWLELLGSAGFAARGIDRNRAMVRQCLDLKLDAQEADALEYLRGLPGESLLALTGFHLIEHLPWQKVIALFDEARRVLRPGGCLILETPNPENILVGSCTFYNDPSHLRPVPPATLEYLAQARGFAGCTIERSSCLDFFVTPPPGELSRLVEVFNCGQDYALIAYKNG